MKDVAYIMWMLFITLNGFHLFIQLVAIIKGLYMIRQRKRSKKNIITFNGHEDLETWPKVSIIKPIIIDDGKIKNLIEHYFQLDYPLFEIHFCFQSKTHSCIQYIHQLAQRYPKVKIFVHTNHDSTMFGNKKILNIAQSIKSIRGELIWIVDENINPSLTSLKEIVTYFDDPDVGCVHQIPVWKCKETLEHTVNMTYFSTHHARFYLLCDALRISCVSGMSMLFDKEKIEEIGGLSSFDRFLSEDYALTVALEQRGYKVKLAPSAAIQDPCICSIQSFVNRMTRWTKLRFNIVFIATFLEPFIHPWLFSIFSAFLLYYLVGISFVFTFILYIIGSFIYDQLLMRIMYIAFPEHGPLPSLFLRLRAFLLIHFVIMPYVFTNSIVNFNYVTWHNASYNITWGTLIVKPEEEIKKNKALSKRFKKFKELQSQSEILDQQDATLKNVFFNVLASNTTFLN